MDRIWRVSRLTWVLFLVAAVLGVSGAAYAGEGWLGVMLQPLSDEIGQAMNLEKGTTGVLVSDVVDDSPADVAGFEKGDVILEIDGASIADVDGAIAKVRDLDSGAKVKMVVLREGKKQVLTAVLGDRADMAAKLESKIESKDDADENEGEGESAEDEYYSFRIPRVRRIFKDISIGQGGYIGVEIRDISADLGAYFGVGCCEGVLVLEVVEDSPAAKAGLKAGDVILKADGEDVSSSGEFAGYVRDHEPGDKLDITFKRSKETRRVTVEVGENDCARIFLNQAGGPDVFGMCCKPGDMRQKCIDLGDKCFMMGKECADRCKMMAGKCEGKGVAGKQGECRVKVILRPEKEMEAQGKAMEGCQKMMEGRDQMKGCPMMQEGKPLPDMGMEHPGLQRPSPEQIEILRGGKGSEADLREEIDQLKHEIENLRQEMEALKQP
jgi:serine protease Do